MLIDNDAAVWRQASRSIKRLSSVPNHRKEKIILPRLEESFRAGQEMHTSLLMGVLGPCATDESRLLLIEIFRNADGRPKPHEIVDSSERVRYSAMVDLKSQALLVLQRFDISELHDKIVDFLPKCDLNWLPAYIEVAGEKKIQEAFDILTSLPSETLDDSAGLVLNALDKINPERACDWATEIVRSTSNPFLMSHCLSFLQKHNINPEDIGGFRSRLFALVADWKNRCQPVLYDLIQRYQIEEAVPQIVNDLPLLFRPDAEQLNMPVYDMFKTLAVLLLAIT